MMLHNKPTKRVHAMLWPVHYVIMGSSLCVHKKLNIKLVSFTRLYLCCCCC